MLHFIMVACLTAFVANAPLFAQQTEDVVYLKNGDIVWGTIVEQIPGESLKIQTADGSVFVYAMNEISKIVRESVMGTEEAATGVEIGTLFGLSHLSSNGDGITIIGVPSAPFAFFGNPSLYVSWFPNEQLAIGRNSVLDALHHMEMASPLFTLEVGVHSLSKATQCPVPICWG